MSSNMSINSNPSFNVDRIQVVSAPVPVNPRPSQTQDTSTEPVTLLPVSPSTTKELKNAEIQGVKIPIGEEQIIRAIERANKALQGKSTSFEFSVHEKTKQIMVKVMDEETGEVIREIPPEKVLDMVAKLWEMAGIIVDEQR